MCHLHPFLTFVKFLLNLPRKRFTSFLPKPGSVIGRNDGWLLHRDCWRWGAVLFVTRFPIFLREFPSSDQEEFSGHHWLQLCTFPEKGCTELPVWPVDWTEPDLGLGLTYIWTRQGYLITIAAEHWRVILLLAACRGEFLQIWAAISGIACD